MDYIGKTYSGEKAKEVYGDKLPPFGVMSHGIGLRYASDNYTDIVINKGLTIHGAQVGIPRYYRKKLLIDQSILGDLAKDKELKNMEIYDKKADEQKTWPGIIIKKSRSQSDKNLRAKKYIAKKGIF